MKVARKSLAAAWLCLTVMVAAPAVAGGNEQSHAGTIAVGDPNIVLLAQDWDDIAAITANDDWSQVPGIVGYMGENLTTATGIDPQTIVADGSGTSVDVIANQTAPNSLTQGGVAEFHLDDPVVALQGSGSADAPHLVLTVNTTGLSGIQVSYLLRDVDGSSDDAVQAVALQYRVGGAGDYVNVPQAFVADASSGPNLAGMETLVDVTLPADADDRALVELRIITTNAAGSDEWIGIDDILVTGQPAAATSSPLRITEWMYSGEGGEFIEFTNVGTEPVDLSGWRYDDDSADPAQGFDLSGFGVVQAGESVVLTESDVEAFRASWGLCAGVKIVGGYTNNLGRNDQINLFDADGVVVDVLTYGDQTFPGSIRTQEASGWVSEAGLGTDQVLEWRLSVVGDAEGSFASTAGVPGSPGSSAHGGFDPCEVAAGPTIAVADAVVVGSVADPTNPGTTVNIDDPDGDPSDLTVTVASSNETVIAASAITVAGTGATRSVSFAPTGRGVATVTFVVADAQGNSHSATMQYGSSNQAPDPSGRYHHRISDASAALGVGDGYVILLNDETNTLFLHREDQSGAPVKTWTFTASELGTSSEIDFEAITRSGDLVLLSGSHGNNRSGSARPERRTFVAATLSGTGADTEIVFRGRYNNLWSELRTWDQDDGHGLGANALGFIAGTAPGVQPNPPGGFNIEGMEFAPDGQTAYLGFRAPTVEIDGRHHGLIVPLLNPAAITDGAPGTGPAQFGAPILVDLDGRSIRALASNGEGGYLISAGPSPQNPGWALYTWDGQADHPPQFNQALPTEDALTGGTWESIGTVPSPLVEGAVVRLVTDSGDSNFYGTGATKDIPQPFQKSYSQEFVLAATSTPDQPPLRITEWMYSGEGGEFIEFTNVGTEPVDLSGWRYDDDSADPAQGFDLSGFGVVQAGESVVLTESDAEAFRASWGLCAGVKIVGGYTNNLGRNDQINLFDADGVVVDVLTYGDQTFPGSIRTQEASGWVSEAGLGTDQVLEWRLSVVGDAEGSFASTAGVPGSPGSSAHGGFDPCEVAVERTLTVTLTGAGGGVVNGGDITCPDQCAATHPEGTSVTLVATPAAGSVFAGWTGDCSGAGNCELTMDADKTVAASFLPAARITINPPQLTAVVTVGESTTLTLEIGNSGGETLDWAITETDCALPAWAALEPSEGSVTGGTSNDVLVTFDAGTLAPDSYTADLCIASNDSATPVVTVPLSLTVTAAPTPVLAFDPVELAFGDVEIGSTGATLTAILSNDGDADATTLTLTSSETVFQVDASACGDTLAAGGQCEVQVSFVPATTEAVTGVVTVGSVQASTAELLLDGRGVEPILPQTDMAITIQTAQDYVGRGELVDYTVTVTNLGPDATTGASVVSTLSAQLDVDAANWLCLGPATSGCTASGQGELVDEGLTLEAGDSVTYLLTAPVRMDADEAVVTEVLVGGKHDGNPANDMASSSSIVVIFRDGFEAEANDETAGETSLWLAEAWSVDEPITFLVDQRGAANVRTVVHAALADAVAGEPSRIRVEQVDGESGNWIRLVASGGADYSERAGDWLAVTDDSAATLLLSTRRDGERPQAWVALHSGQSVLEFPVPFPVSTWAVRVLASPEGHTEAP